MNLILTHQFISQLEPPIRDAILGNAGTIISFRVGIKDAEIMGKVFYPEFPMHHIINLPNYSIYLKLMIEGEISKPFSADTLLDLDQDMAE